MTNTKQSWKDTRIKEINNMGYKCDDSHPCFEEVQAIYKSDAKSYEEFEKELLGQIFTL